MQEVYKNIKEYNPGKNVKSINSLCDMIADIISNKNFNLVPPELLIRGRKQKISLFL